MTDKQKSEFVKYWIPTVVFILMIVAYVWSSATRFQMIESLGLENKGDIVEVKEVMGKKFDRIDDKLDAILQKMR